MSGPRLPDTLVARRGGGRIVLVVMDGLGGLPHPGSGRTELETARTPNLDALAARASLGMLTPVEPGITPGSGPAHLALFGYDPVECLVGRGALSALGVGMELEPGDLAARLNLATLGGDGTIVDRRAGRPTDAEGQRIVARLQAGLEPPEGIEIRVRHEKEHRAVLVLRGGELGENLRETDPQEVGVPPLSPDPLDPDSERSSSVLGALLGQAREILSDEGTVTGILARGYSTHRGFPSIRERFGLRGAAVAGYPMYRGVARLVGMEARGRPASDAEAVEELVRLVENGEHDFLFLHFKAPDARGEDGDFRAKVAAIEAVDGLFSRITEAGAEVTIVTGDHSTPATYGAHSWHPVPVLIRSRWVRPTGRAFTEAECRSGELGIFRARHLMSLALAHAGRLEKFGA